MLQCYKDTKYKKKKKIRSKRTNNNNKKHNYQCVDYSLLKEDSIWAQARKKKKNRRRKSEIETREIHIGKASWHFLFKHNIITATCNHETSFARQKKKKRREHSRNRRNFGRAG